MLLGGTRRRRVYPSVIRAAPLQRGQCGVEGLLKDERNSKPNPLRWAAAADTILAKNARARQALQLLAASTK